MGARDHAPLSSLPAVHEVAAALELTGASHVLAVAAARQAIQERRTELRGGSADDPSPGNGETFADDLAARARELLGVLTRRSLRPVLNATGVILHTNLGRAPLAPAAADAVVDAARYTNLELDLSAGNRGSRQAHVEQLLCELTGAEAALVVNNGAAAVLLATAALAGDGATVLVSRGQLVEIGGGFRIPEVVRQSGAQLAEVGTTNRTRAEDYMEAIDSRSGQVGAILRVHPSNFRTVGFVEDVSVQELCRLGPPVIDDVGSGVLSATYGPPALAGEPAVAESVAAGAAIVCCSADKLLGGPQAGLLVGRREAVASAARHPLARALRIDKLSLAALEATLRLLRDPGRAAAEIPVLRMLSAGEEELRARADALRDAVGSDSCEVVRSAAKVGGGALPLLELEGPVVALHAERPDALASALRSGDPAVVGRVQQGRLLLDPRTLTDDEVGEVGAAVRGALAHR